MVGASGVTVKLALLLGTLPEAFVTTTEYRAPLSDMLVAGVV